MQAAVTPDALRLPGEKLFLCFASACALVTVISTIAIHQIQIPAGSFEVNVQLYKSKAYLVLNWLILFHCLMVLISMLGMALIIRKSATALAILGLLLFALFVFAEWERTLGNLWHINGLRKRYAATTNVEVLQFLRYEIQHRLFQSNVQFLLFTIGFTLGNLSYGVALFSGNNRDRLLGAGLCFWALCTSLTFLSDFFPAPWMEAVISACNNYYQPAIRLFIAYWLFVKAREAAKPLS